jgi:hypothetical protein
MRFKQGDKVYYDSFSGPIKCVVVKENTRRCWKNIVLKVTARKHRVYSCGELIETSPTWVFKRSELHCRRGMYYFRAEGSTHETRTQGRGA